MQYTVSRLHAFFTDNFSTLNRANASAIILSPVAYATPYSKFQYPQSGQCLCNQSGTRHGSSRTWNFSTLNRANASAIGVTDALTSGLITFQYPQSGQCLCNFALLNERSWYLVAFQYPQSGQCLCNPSRPKSHIASGPTFQYPQSGQCLCNFIMSLPILCFVKYFSTLNRANASAMSAGMCAHMTSTKISVPSIGPMPLQCIVSHVTMHASLYFSTLNRANASAMMVIARMRALYRHFSTLNRANASAIMTKIRSP